MRLKESRGVGNFGRESYYFFVYNLMAVHGEIRRISSRVQKHHSIGFKLAEQKFFIKEPPAEMSQTLTADNSVLSKMLH